MPDGLVALTGLQAGIESVRGTSVAATRIQPCTATMKSIVERYAPQEDRNSFEDFFRSAQTKERVEITGAKAWATFEDLPWFLQLFAKGGVTGVLSNVAAYTYTFLPTASVDDLSTATFEVFNDTQSFMVNWVVGKKLELNYQRGQPVEMTMDFFGQHATKQAKTGSLTQRTTEDITDGLTAAYIDTTTIGTTLVADVLSAKWTLDNMWEPIYTLNGTRYPNKFIRARRHVEAEAILQFDATVEYDAFMTGTNRKLRLKSTGSVIPTSSPSTNKSVSADFYTAGWDTADFGRQGGIWTASLKGRSTYDSTATASWQISVVNGLATLP